MTEFDFGSIENKAIASKILSSAVPFFVENDETHGIIGTGSFFTSMGKYFFITARHVIDAVTDYNHAGIPTGDWIDAYNEGRRFVEREIFVIRDATKHVPANNKHDVAIIELHDTEFIDSINKSWNIITPSDFCFNYRIIEYCIIAGFPGALRYTLAGKDQFPLIYIPTSPLKPDKANKGVKNDEGYDPKTHFYLNYGKTYNFKGKEQQSPRLQGISGSLVWAKTLESTQEGDGRVLSPVDYLKVIGIETRFCHSRFIKAVFINTIEGMFKQLDKEIFEEIHSFRR